MNGTESLGDRIKVLVTQRELLVEARREMHRRRMVREDEFWRYFDERAGRLFDEVVLPRMRQAADMVEHARLIIHREELAATLALNQSEALLARIDLMIALSGSAEGGIRVLAQPRLVPILVEFEREDALALSGDAGDDERVARFVDDRIVGILETYVKIEQDPRYHEVVVDPICRIKLMRDDAVACGQHKGTRFFFCSLHCQEIFAQDPDLHAAPYVSTAWHRQKEHEATTDLVVHGKAAGS